MTLYAARPSRFSLIVHAIDDTGALCGARPKPKWLSTKSLPINVPINCPRCLSEMGRPRFAFCETVTASSLVRLHVRRVGAEGVSFTGSVGSASTYCGLPVGWDREGEVSAVLDEDKDQFICGRCKTAYNREVRGRTRRQLGLKPVE